MIVKCRQVWEPLPHIDYINYKLYIHHISSFPLLGLLQELLTAHSIFSLFSSIIYFTLYFKNAGHLKSTPCLKHPVAIHCSYSKSQTLDWTFKILVPYSPLTVPLSTFFCSFCATATQAFFLDSLTCQAYSHFCAFAFVPSDWSLFSQIFALLTSLSFHSQTECHFLREDLHKIVSSTPIILSHIFLFGFYILTIYFYLKT